jgi:hypothetical protein
VIRAAARVVALLGATAFSACGAPPPPAPLPRPEQAEPPAPVGQADDAPPIAQVTKLENGLVATVHADAPGACAQLQIGFLVGSNFVAPGLAELAATAIVQGADASSGRTSLEQAIARLGGIVEIGLGPAMTWIDISVPASRWRAAEAALVAALRAQSLSRAQFDRIRDELVQKRCAEIRDDPLRATARALLLGEPDTAAYVTALVDRDASEVALFQARYLRPDNARLALRAPGDPKAIAASLAEGGADRLAKWTAAQLNVPAQQPLGRTFASDLLWSPTRGTSCRAAMLIFLPDATLPGAADLLVVHACLTLDGAGGRLERMLAERGLGHLRWRSEFVRGADGAALLLTTDASVTDALAAWQCLRAARRSLQDVPPTTAEIQLARRRAALTAGIVYIGGMARLRAQANMQLRGGTPADLSRRFAELARPERLDPQAVGEYLALPAPMFVIGGEVPPDAPPNVQRWELLPPGFAPTAEPDAQGPTAAAAPWLDGATEAVGSEALLQRFRGFDADAAHRGEDTPTAHDRVEWRIDGDLRRTREVLGKVIETRLEGKKWTETCGGREQTLTARETGLLQRELERHPIALLAAWHRGALAFEAVAQRNVGGRDFMVLEAAGNRFDRLRIHLDTRSLLIRLVEVWELLPDGTTVHLQDAWSDYRTTGGLRAPFRRVTTQDDGQNSVETVWSKWQPVLAAP